NFVDVTDDVVVDDDVDATDVVGDAADA
ncbi:hypothetical protein A2U01_0101118, partial [Trifolium medium]|nr:hypothetical protein [Trifolium medium]